MKRELQYHECASFEIFSMQKSIKILLRSAEILNGVFNAVWKN